MKVRELIVLLEQQPQETLVNFYNHEISDYIQLLTIEQSIDTKGKIKEVILNIGY